MKLQFNIKLTNYITAYVLMVLYILGIVPEGKMGHFCQIVILGTFKGLFREPPYTM